MGKASLSLGSNVDAEANLRSAFAALRARFGAVYRLDKAVLAPCLEARQEIAEAMGRLLDFRQKASAALLVEQPVRAPQRGLMAWLKQHASRRYKT